MLTARASGDPVPGYAGNTYVLDVISAGVRVFMYDKGYLHAKTISINSEICSIGSSNIDIRSFSINYEINAVLYSRKLAKKLEEAFERNSPTARNSTRPSTSAATSACASGIPLQVCSLPFCRAKHVAELAASPAGDYRVHTTETHFGLEISVPSGERWIPVPLPPPAPLSPLTMLLSRHTRGLA